MTNNNFLKLVDEDFQDYISYIILDGLVEKKLLVEPHLKKFKTIHKTTYAILLLNKGLRNKNESNIFFDEISSSFVQLLPLALRGQFKLSNFLLRDSIENCLKYIYYFDHKIEFSWLSQPEKYFIDIEELLKYLEKHPALMGSMHELEIKSKVKSLYSHLSLYVHSRSPRYMQLKKYLKGVKFSDDKFNNFVDDFKKSTEIIIPLIILFNLQEFFKMNIVEKRFILNTISGNYKKYIQSL